MYRFSIISEIWWFHGQKSKSAFFRRLYPPQSPLKPSQVCGVMYGTNFLVSKNLEALGYPMVKTHDTMIIRLYCFGPIPACDERTDGQTDISFGSIPACDGRTDGRTDDHAAHSLVAHMQSRCATKMTIWCRQFCSIKTKKLPTEN